MNSISWRRLPFKSHMSVDQISNASFLNQILSVRKFDEVTYFPGGGGVLPYMSYIGMCRCEGYGFQRVYSQIGYRNQRVLV